MTTVHHPGAFIVASGSPPQRVPVSAIVSIAIHVGLLGLWLHVNHGRKDAARVIADVDLMIQAKRPIAAQAAPASPKLTDFLKLALPSIPKIEPKRLEVKLPEPKKTLETAQPKLQDKGRRIEGPKIQPLDLERQKLDLARIEQKTDSRKTAALASLPRLEEVGRRRVANLPQALKLEEKRQEALALQRFEVAAPAGSRRAPIGAMDVLKENESAPPPNSRLASKLAAVLPTEQRPVAAAGPVPDTLSKRVEPAPSRRESAGLQQGESKKNVEIEGPLADRKVVAYHIPEFPKWARDQGVLEASVAIKFWVSRQGEVLPNMRVESTSGYGRLDRLAMDALKMWRFAPLASDERQWGIITFRFILE